MDQHRILGPRGDSLPGQSTRHWPSEASFVPPGPDLLFLQALQVQQYVLKGMQLAVNGRLQKDIWTAHSGETRSAVKAYSSLPGLIRCDCMGLNASKATAECNRICR